MAWVLLVDFTVMSHHEAKLRSHSSEVEELDYIVIVCQFNKVMFVVDYSYHVQLLNNI